MKTTSQRIFAALAIGMISTSVLLSCSKVKVQELSQDSNPLPHPTPIPSPIPGPGSLSGQVTYAEDGSGLSGVTVKVHSGDDSSTLAAVVTTDSNGNYSVGSLAAGTHAVDFGLQGYITISNATAVINTNANTTLNETMTNFIPDGQYRIVLNWTDSLGDGTDPSIDAVRDVDSYLQIPGESVPIGFENLTDSNSTATLDHDDTQWSGPETVTIKSELPGTYIYYVNNYNIRDELTSLGNSKVTIHLYKGSQLLKVYTVPPGTGDTYEVFQIVNGNVVDVEKYNDSLYVFPASGGTGRNLVPKVKH